MLSHDARDSDSISAIKPLFLSIVMALTFPFGVVSSRALSRASLSFFAMLCLDVSGGNRDSPGNGSSRISQALMAAQPSALSTVGDIGVAAMEL
jgi:hypothetical protein